MSTSGSEDHKTDLRRNLSSEVLAGLVSPIERHIDLDRWGFELTFVHPNNERKVIYDCDSCRAKFLLDVDVREGDRVLIWYARPNVPNDVDLFMEQGGERCYAWHHIHMAPYWQFLEGLTVEEAAEHDRNQLRWPAYAEFTDTGRGVNLQGVDWSLAFHEFVLQRYGSRLFSLFDLRQPDRWEEFRRYIKEFYRLRPHKPMLGDTFPPRYQVC